MLDDIIDDGEFDDVESLEELKKAIQNRVNEYNETPQDELGGLSPEQVSKLLYTDWADPNSPITLRDSLSDEEVGSVKFVKNSRILLETAQDKDGLPATQAGNLKRKVVADFLDRMDFGPRTVEIIREVNKVINEGDVRPLNVLRVVLEVGNLLELSDGSFRTTSLAAGFLKPELKSEFMKYLFITYFKDFNIAYFTRGGEWPEIQETLPFAFYQLSRLDDRWYDGETLANRLILPAIKEDAEEAGEDLLWMHYSIRVLKPLVKFDLLEWRGSGVQGMFEMSAEYRKSPLFDRFMKIDL